MVGAFSVGHPRSTGTGQILGKAAKFITHIYQ
jgi:hypothetical protein